MQKRREDRQLREEVLSRDSKTCQMCKKKHRVSFLQIHHIIPWSKAIHLRFDAGNCITLCYHCHKSISKKEHLYQTYFLGILHDQKKKRL